MLSDGDREYLKAMTQELLLAQVSHCAAAIKEAIAEHERKSIMHNPVKSLPVIGIIVAAVESVRNMLRH